MPIPIGIYRMNVRVYAILLLETMNWKFLEMGMAKKDGKNWKQGWKNFLVGIGNRTLCFSSLCQKSGLF